MSTSVIPSAAQPAASHRPRGFYALIWLLFAVVGVSWSAVTPIAGSPDEPDHLLRAVAVVRGQISGPMEQEASLPQKGPRTLVAVPQAFAELEEAHACFYRQPGQPATCQPPIASEPGPTVIAPTSAGQYNPVYYLMVGTPTLLPDPAVGLYLARVLSVLVATAFLAWAVRALDRLAVLGSGAARVLGWAALIALTPTTLFLLGALNPNGLEITGVVSLWSAMIALAVLPGREGTRASVPSGYRPLLVQAVVSAAMVCTLRPVSPLWVLLTIALTLVLAGLTRVRALVLRTEMIWVALAAVAVSVWVLGWTLTRGTLVGAVMIEEELADPLAFLAHGLGNLDRNLRDAIGNFSWLDTPLPAPWIWAWVIAALALIVLAFLPGRGARQQAGIWWRTAFALAILAHLIVPLALNWSTRVSAGFIWQGRYSLPILAGIMLLAGVGLALKVGPRVPAPRWLTPLLIAVTAVVIVVHSVSVYWVALRFTRGLPGNDPHETTIADMLIPTGDAVAVLATAAAMGILGWLLLLREPRRPEGASTQPMHP